MIEVQNILVEHEGVLHTLSLCRHCDIPILFLATHAVVPLLACRRRRDVACPNDEVAEPLALESLECVALDHRPEDGEDLGFGDRFWKACGVTLHAELEERDGCSPL